MCKHTLHPAELTVLSLPMQVIWLAVPLPCSKQTHCHLINEIASRLLVLILTMLVLFQQLLTAPHLCSESLFGLRKVHL